MTRITLEDARADRGVSETLSVVLLFALVVAGIGAVIGAGAVVIDGVEDRNQDAAVEGSVLRVDEQLGSVAAAEGNLTRGVTARNFDTTTTRVVNRTEIRFVVNGDPDCAATYYPGAVVTETDGGTTFVYESGAVWELTDDGGFSVESLPELTYDDGVVSVSLVGVGGDAGNGDFTASRNATASRDETRRLNAALFGRRGCRNVNNFTVSVSGPYDRGWGQALEREFGTDLANGYDDGDDTVTLVLDQDDLSADLDREANEVVDFGSDLANVTASNSTVTVDKPAGTTYPTTAEVLSDPQVGPLVTANVSATDERDPIDVVFVTDASGSMGFEAPPVEGGDDDRVGRWGGRKTNRGCSNPGEEPDCTTKMYEAKQATLGFVGSLQPGDRTTTVLWDSGGAGLAGGQALTANLDRANASVLDITDTPSGGTDLSNGLDLAITHVENNDIPSHQPVFVVLSDGENVNGDNAAAVALAEEAGRKGITIQSVGFGSANDTLLYEVANATGGRNYTADNASELSTVFDAVSESVLTRQEIPNHPITMTLRTSDGETYAPFGRGGLRNASYRGRNITDVNNPLGSTRVGYSFELRDGTYVVPSATSYVCREYENGVSKRGTRYESACNATDTVRARTDATTNRDRLVILTDGDDPGSATDPTLYAWQTNLTEQLANEGLLNASGYVDLDSNQFVVAYDLSSPSSPGAGNHNNLLVLYEVGVAETEFDPGSVIRIGADRVDLERGG